MTGSDSRFADVLRERLSNALAGSYEIERELGRGGMATVYLAADLRHGRHVALKVLNPDIASAVGAERFLREIQIMASLNHPNILPLLDSGDAGGNLYYVMPRVEGESLRQRIDREGQLPIDDAVEILTEVADALGYAHSHDVVHRDIKPGNIMLSGGHAFVADFGIARAITSIGSERMTDTGIAVGTPAYMSPEQAGADKVIDGRSDIYSLSCVGYEMLGGAPPFSGPTAQAIASRHMFEPPPDLLIVRPKVPDPVLDAINRGLAKTPADRFATGDRFKQALNARAVPRFRNRSWLKMVTLRAFGAAAVVAAVVFGWLSVIRPGESLDPNRFVVFPLATTNPAPGGDAGWRAALAMQQALEQAEPLKPIDGWSRLSSDVRTNPTQLTASMAVGIGVERRAGYYIHGAIRLRDDSASVVVRLHDVEGDSILGQETATGPTGTGDVEFLAVRALARLLPRLIDPVREVDFAPFLNSAPGAVALSIQGDREYRQSRFGAALEFYRRAVDADSSLAFAAVKGAQAASWSDELEEAHALIDLALANSDSLPLKYRDFAIGLGAYLGGHPDSAVSAFETALQRDRSWTEGLMALGETYYHLLPSSGRVDSLAETAFLAAAADDQFLPPAVHLTEIAVRRGQVDKATRTLDQLREARFDSSTTRKLSFMVQCVRVGPERYDWSPAAESFPLEVLKAAVGLSPGAAQKDCAEAALRALVWLPEAPSGVRWGSVQALQGLLIAQSREEEALAVLDSAIASGLRGPYYLYVFDALESPVFSERAVMADEIMTGARGQYYAGATREAQWLFAVWQIRRGNREVADSLQRLLQYQADMDGDREAGTLAHALRGHLALDTGDTTLAIEELRALTPFGSRQDLEWGLAAPLPAERYLLASLLLSRGDFEAAMEVASVFDHPQPVMYLPYLQASIRLRLAAASELKDNTQADVYRERLRALVWVDD